MTLEGPDSKPLGVMLFFVSTVAFLDRQTLSVLEKTLEKVLAFSATEYSYIVTGFLVATGLGYMFAGRLIDRFGLRTSFAVALTAWSLAAMAHSLAAGWISLLVLRVALGRGECFYTPAAARVLRDWIPVRERGVCWAVFSTGTFAGAIIAPPLVAWLALRYPWEFSFVATGALGFALLGVWLWFYDSPERHPRLSVAERTVILEGRGASPAASETIPTFRLLCRPAFCGFFSRGWGTAQPDSVLRYEGGRSQVISLRPGCRSRRGLPRLSIGNRDPGIGRLASRGRTRGGEGSWPGDRGREPCLW